MFVCVSVTAITHGNIERETLSFDSNCEVTMVCVVPTLIKISPWYRSRLAEFLSSGRMC